MFAVRSRSAFPQASIHTPGIPLDQSTEPNPFVVRERGPPPAGLWKGEQASQGVPSTCPTKEDSMFKSSFAAIAAASCVVFAVACQQAATSPSEINEFAPRAEFRPRRRAQRR